MYKQAHHRQGFEKLSVISLGIEEQSTWKMKVFCNTKNDVLLHMFRMAFGESKDILLTKRKGGDARGNDSHQFQREPTGEEGSEGILRIKD